jgi:hypothetical protein
MARRIVGDGAGQQVAGGRVDVLADDHIVVIRVEQVLARQVSRGRRICGGGRAGGNGDPARRRIDLRHGALRHQQRRTHDRGQQTRDDFGHGGYPHWRSAAFIVPLETMIDRQ